MDLVHDPCDLTHRRLWHDGVRADLNRIMHSKTPPRNRLAKVLPDEWRSYLVDHGVPKRKYMAVLKATLTDGRVIENLIVEQGWIIALDRNGVAGQFEQRIDFDPRTIASIEIIQVA